MVRGSIFLRAGLAIVFGYFSFMQFADPVLWTSYLPAFLGTSTAIVYVNAVIDAIFAFCLLCNIIPRFIALLAAAHLLVIAFSMGLNDVAVRDFGLAMGCLSLAIIHEEHISNRQRAVLTHLFGKD